MFFGHIHKTLPFELGALSLFTSTVGPNKEQDTFRFNGDAAGTWDAVDNLHWSHLQPIAWLPTRNSFVFILYFDASLPFHILLPWSLFLCSFRLAVIRWAWLAAMCRAGILIRECLAPGTWGTDSPTWPRHSCLLSFGLVRPDRTPVGPWEGS